MRAIAFLALVAGIALFGCVGGPDSSTGTLYPDGDYQHAATGLVFPEEIGAFTRTHVSRYDSDSLNVSGHYEFDGPTGAVATVYFYPFSADGSFPTHAALSASFERAKKDIVLTHDSASLRAESGHQVLVNGSSLVGFHAVYSIDGSGEQTLASHLQLYALENWLLKFRFTHAEADEEALAPHRAVFVESIRWPIPGGGVLTPPHPNCVSIADSYEMIARNKDAGLSEDQQLELVGAPGEAEYDKATHAILLNAISVANAYPDRTSLQIRKLVLADCTVDEAGRASLNRYWPWKH